MTMAPGDSLLSDAAVLVEAGTVMAVGPYADLCRAYPDAPVRDMGDVTLVPGLINAHCHLELSAMRGGMVSGLGFMEWVKHLIVHPKRPFSEEHVRGAVEEMRRTGVCFVADISANNTQAVAGVLDDSGFFFVCFKEHILFAMPEQDHVFIPGGVPEHGFYSAAGHALYSTHPDLLCQVKDVTRQKGLPYSLHLAECEEETDALMGRNSWYTDLMDRLGISHEGFVPSMCSPVKYARDLGLLDSFTLAVHCVRIDDDDISILRQTGTNVCLCPRSNEFIGVGRAPWEKLLAAGVNCCLGTDSLASNHDLDLWNELRFMKERFAGELSLDQGVAMMTVHPARALGLARLGSIAPGKNAAFAVIPQDVEALFNP